MSDNDVRPSGRDGPVTGPLDGVRREGDRHGIPAVQGERRSGPMSARSWPMRVEPAAMASFCGPSSRPGPRARRRSRGRSRRAEGRASRILPGARRSPCGSSGRWRRSRGRCVPARVRRCRRGSLRSAGGLSTTASFVGTSGGAAVGHGVPRGGKARDRSRCAGRSRIRLRGGRAGGERSARPVPPLGSRPG
jgi:hypothetical protein